MKFNWINIKKNLIKLKKDSKIYSWTDINDFTVLKIKIISKSLKIISNIYTILNYNKLNILNQEMKQYIAEIENIYINDENIFQQFKEKNQNFFIELSTLTQQKIFKNSNSEKIKKNMNVQYNFLQQNEFKITFFNKKEKLIINQIILNYLFEKKKNLNYIRNLEYEDEALVYQRRFEAMKQDIDIVENKDNFLKIINDVEILHFECLKKQVKILKENIKINYIIFLFFYRKIFVLNNF